MHDEHLIELVKACGLSAIACFLVARRDLGRWPALILAVVRCLIPLAYFGWYFDGTRLISW